MGYLVLENGVYMFGVGTAIGNPWIVEAGVLLDVLAACSSWGSSCSISIGNSTTSIPTS
jgi:hypothetical protein